MFKDRNDNSHKGSTEKFWAMKIGFRKAIVDVKTKPLELYIDEDILSTIGYNSKRIKCDGRTSVKVKHNEYCYLKRHIYSEQIFLPAEQHIIMNSQEIYTMLKRRPIDELFSILLLEQSFAEAFNMMIHSFLDFHGSKET